MFRFFSVLSLFIVLILAFVSFFYFNEDFGWEIYFYNDLVVYASIILLFSLLIRAQTRWQKLLVTDKLIGYRLNTVGWNKSLLNEFLPFFIYIPISILFLIYVSEAKWVSLILCLYIIEGLVHVLVGKKKYQLIINKQSIVVVRNKQYIIFWDKVKTIVFKYQGIIVLENSGNQIFISEFDFENFDKLSTELKELAIAKKIYISQ
jgi:hypothetical protein